jgi:hypothetical protein
MGGETSCLRGEEEKRGGKEDAVSSAASDSFVLSFFGATTAIITDWFSLTISYSQHERLVDPSASGCNGSGLESARAQIIKQLAGGFASILGPALSEAGRLGMFESCK